MPINQLMCNKRQSKFLTSEVEYCRSCEPQESWLSLEHSMMKSSTLFERRPLPPYVHLTSTRCHSCDRCSQAFPIFHALPLPCIILKETKERKMGEAWEQGYQQTVLHHNYVIIDLFKKRAPLRLNTNKESTREGWVWARPYMDSLRATHVASHGNDLVGLCK